MTDPATPSKAAPEPAAPAEAPKTPWLTTEPSEAFGPAGSFVDLTKAESDAAPKGVLVKPTADQLALRVKP